MYMAKMLLRFLMLASMVFILSYLWQSLSPSWTQETVYDFALTDNYTLLEQVQSQVEKETSAAVNPYLSNGIQS